MQLITLLGQTSSGKSNLAIDLVKNLNFKGKKACIVGCDSRQVYRGLSIGTGKVEGSWIYDNETYKSIFEFEGVTHYMIDFVNPEINYNLQNFVSDFYDLILDIQNSFDYVILVGGTGLYAKAIIEQIDLGNIKSQYLQAYNEYKIELQNLDLLELQLKLKDLNIQLNNSDHNNRVRLVSNLLKNHSQKLGWIKPSQYFKFEKQYLFAIEVDQNQLKQKIENRLIQRFNKGLIDEIKQFEYLGEPKFLSLGLEYRQAWHFMHGKLTHSQLQINLLTENLQYAKRQLTWLKKQKNLMWIRNFKEIISLIE